MGHRTRDGAPCLLISGYSLDGDEVVVPKVASNDRSRSERPSLAVRMNRWQAMQPTRESLRYHGWRRPGELGRPSPRYRQNQVR